MQNSNSSLASSFEILLNKRKSEKELSGQLFSQNNGAYLNELVLFHYHFNAIPNSILEKDIDCKKAIHWLSENYQTEIKQYYFNKRYFRQSKKVEIDDAFYFLFQDLIIYLDRGCSEVRFLFSKTETEQVEKIIASIKQFKKRKKREKPEIKLLVNSSSGIQLKSLEISKPKLSIADNYNDDFIDIHKVIFKRLSIKNNKGLVLLHGKPGTGKTSYIRYLVASIKKDIIFLPVNLASSITSPGLISILIDNPNSILVIEDAEKIIVDREKEGGSPVSVLLNITDGLLADCLNVQVICSFNTDISKVDSALMRKGRLIAKYEFKELQSEKAQVLSNKLGFTSTIKQPMTLTDIYNQTDLNFSQIVKSSTIGFKVA